MPDAIRTLSSHAAVTAALCHADLVVPPVPTDVSAAGLGWLRAAVARFAEGPDHRRRRDLAVGLLAGIDPAACRRDARERARQALRATGKDTAGSTLDTATALALAGTVPVELLADALCPGARRGLPDGALADVVAVAARGYLPHTDQVPGADEAVRTLVAAFGGTADEPTAARIGLLLQARGATAALVETALRHPGSGTPVLARLVETLRHDPPLPAMRRQARTTVRLGGEDIAAGTLVLLDLVAANRDPAVFTDPERFDPARADSARHLTFGAGRHACPGSEHALAIAAGIVEAVAAHPGAGGDGAAGARDTAGNPESVRTGGTA